MSGLFTLDDGVADMANAAQWLEAKFTISEEASEALTERLIQFGACGIATQDPFELKRLLSDNSTTIFVDPEFLDDLPDYVTVKAYFACDDRGVRLIPSLADDDNPFLAVEQYLYQPSHVNYCRPEDLLANLRAMLADLAQFLPIGLGKVEVGTVNEEDWANNWKQYYHPIEISDSLVICPEWEDYNLKPGQKMIKMNPGSAFGTGSHETTSLCLKLLAENMKPTDLILDLGCGSGILAIAAAKLGGKSITAIDIDPLAVKVCQDNIRLNNVAEQVTASAGEISSLAGQKFDLILGNLLAEVLAALAPALYQAVKTNGKLICSGIVAHKADIVSRAFTPDRWELTEERKDNDWIARIYRRR